jgi:hypothetical protein
MIDTPKTDKPIQSKSEKEQPDGCIADFAGDIPQQRHVNITAMIRSLQRTEGYADCFRRGLADCDQLDCAWRQYCLDNTDSLTSTEDP